MTEEPITHRALREALGTYSKSDPADGDFGNVDRGMCAPLAFIAVQRVLEMISPIKPGSQGYPLADAIRFELERTFL